MNLAEYRPSLSRRLMTDITAADCRALGAKAVAIDADNTSNYDGTDKPLPGAVEWVHAMRDEGLPVILLTNGRPTRVRRLSKCYGGIPYVAFAGKPDPKGFYQAAEKMHCTTAELVMVGDQLLTDVRGANRAGSPSIWVTPYEKEKRLRLHFAIRRFQERILMRRMKLDPERNDRT